MVKYNKNDNIDLLNQVSALIEENNLLRDFAEKAIKQYNYDFQYRLQEMIDVLKKPK